MEINSAGTNFTLRYFYLLSIMMMPVIVFSLVSCGGSPGSPGSTDDISLSEPNSPQFVSGIPGRDSGSITWNPTFGYSAGDGRYFNIYMAAASGVTKTNHQSLLEGARFQGVTPPFNIYDLTNGRDYFFVITAVIDSKESKESEEIKITPTNAIPIAPTGLEGSPGDGLATISWDAVESAGSYNILRAEEPGISKININSLQDGKKTTSYNNAYLDTELDNGTTYYYVVTAVNGVGESIESTEISVTPLIGATAPTQSVSNITDTTVTLNGNFHMPTGFETYAWFEYGTNSSYSLSTTPQIFATVGQVSVSANISGLEGWTEYQFILVTRNSLGTFKSLGESFTTTLTPQVLLSDLDAPTKPLFDGTYIYWMEIYGHRVRRFNTQTGETSLVASVTFGGNDGSIIIDNTHVYWADYRNIWRAELDGANLISLASTELYDLKLIAVRPEGIYLKNNYQNIQTLSRLSLDGNTMTVLFGRTPNSSEGFGGGVVFDDEYIYWSDYFKGTIQKMPITGGTPVTLAVSLESPFSLAIHGSTLYVSEWGHRRKYIKRLSVSGGQLSNFAETTGWLTIDGTDMFVNTGSNLQKIDFNNGDISTLVVVQEARYAPIVTATEIYWINDGNHYYPPLGSLSKAIRK